MKKIIKKKSLNLNEKHLKVGNERKCKLNGYIKRFDIKKRLNYCIIQ